MVQRHLFTYGSLMFAPVWGRLAQGDYASTRAWLKGFKRTQICNDNYPVIVPSPNHSPFAGIVYRGVGLSDLKRLDAFEGKIYIRTRVRIWVANKPLAAHTYVLKRRFYYLAGRKLWHPQSFEYCLLPAFIKAHLSKRD